MFNRVGGDNYVTFYLSTIISIVKGQNIGFIIMREKFIIYTFDPVIGAKQKANHRAI
jgi:hypothetical protein